MLSKLSIRNAKRSFKDYIIYLITVTLALSLMFTFNLVSFSKEVINISSIMENFKFTLYIVNIFIILAICFLINYTIKFMFAKRSKEFGTYMLLGIKKKAISNLFTCENMILGFFSFLISIPIGFLFSQFASIIIMQLFELDTIVHISFNIKALYLLFLYFIIIYIIVLIFARHRIKKIKIYDLLYFEKKNEKEIKKNKKIYILIFILSFFLGLISLVLFDKQFSTIGKEPSLLVIFISIILIILSIYGTSITFAGFILNFVLKRKKIKYYKDNLFITRTFYSKIKSMSFTLGTLTVFIAFTLVALNLSTLFKGMFDYQIDLTAPYDISIATEKEKIEEYLNIIKEEYTIKEKFVYESYVDGTNVFDVINKKKEEAGWRETDHLISLSDYNKLLELRGLPKQDLKDNEYILHVTKEYKKILENEKALQNIKLSNGITLKQKKFIFENYSLAWGSGFGFIIIIPDDAIKDLQVINTHLIVNTKEETTEAFEQKLVNRINSDICEENEDGITICYSLGNVNIKGAQKAQNNGFITITSFICYYIAFIFTAIVGTILAIQSLSDSTKYKYRYTVLKKLGVKQEDLFKMIKKQLLLFFMTPLLSPIIVSFSTIYSMNKIFKIALVTDTIYLKYLFLNLGIFLLLYLIYFLATYFGFKKNINE